MSTVEQHVSAKIRERREALGQSKSATARAVGVHLNTHRITEDTGTNITVERLCQYALALGVEPADLLPCLDELPRLVGLGGVERLQAIKSLRGKAWEAAVLEGAKTYYTEHMARPRTDGGDASAYVGFDTTWSAINFALARGSHGAKAWGGLHRFLDHHGVGETRRRAGY